MHCYVEQKRRQRRPAGFSTGLMRLQMRTPFKDAFVVAVMGEAHGEMPLKYDENIKGRNEKTSAPNISALVG